jgi:uncharacterized protein
LRIHVEGLLQEKGSNQSFDVNLTLPDLTWQEDAISFTKPLSVNGLIANKGDVLDLNADVKGEVTLQCGSCLESYKQSLDFSFETRLIKSSVESVIDEDDWDEDYVDAFFFEGNEVDLSKIVQEFLLLELPMLRRCKENCKGLCSICGTNLNQETCKCFHTEDDDSHHLVDERLKVLKDFFTTEGEEV